MKLTRNRFLKLLGLSGLSAYLFPYSMGDSQPEMLKPPRLKRGDTIGLVSPSSILPEAGRYDEIRSTIRALGFSVKEGVHARNRHGYLAGTDEARAADLNTMFADPQVDAILPFRGGWGSNRILDLLDYDSIRRNPKLLIGFSDITSLLLAIYAKTGLITFHGPVGKSEWTEFTTRHFKMAAMHHRPFILRTGDPGSVEIIRSGQAKGKLLGGNLSVLTSMLGSNYLPDWEGAILFLEDVGEKYYRIDRMLTHLKMAGVLEQISGFVFGKCTSCKPAYDYSPSLKQIFEDHISPLSIPAFRGAMIGHIDNMVTLPVGVRAEIDADVGTIRILESPVS